MPSFVPSSLPSAAPTTFAFTAVGGSLYWSDSAKIGYNDFAANTTEYVVGNLLIKDSLPSDIQFTTQKIVWLNGANCPIRNEAMLVGIGSASNPGQVVGALSNRGVWSKINVTGVGEVLATNTPGKWPHIVVVYESTSGNALLVWYDQSKSLKLRYSIWDSSSWTIAAGLSIYTFGVPNWMQMASHPDSNEIVLVVGDSNNDAHALVWNGSNWIDVHTFTTSMSTENSISVAYEAKSGHAMVVYGVGTASSVSYAIWDGTSWAVQTPLSSPGSISGFPYWTSLKQHIRSDKLVLGVQTSNTKIWLCIWNGAAWEVPFDTTTTAYQTDPGGLFERNFDVAFESDSGEALAVFGHNGNTLKAVDYCTWVPTSGWSSISTTVTGFKNLPRSAITLDPFPTPGSNEIMLSVEGTGNVDGVLWNGIGWNTITQEVSKKADPTLMRNWIFLWDIPITSGTVVYADDSDEPKYQGWTGEVFNGEKKAAKNQKRYYWIQSAEAPTRNEKIIVGITKEGYIQAQIGGQGGGW